MLDSHLKTQLKTYLEKVVQPVELIASLDDSDASRDMRSLLEDIVSLSNLITLSFDTTPNAHTPSFSINRANKAMGQVGIRFAGIPLGHEFTSLVLALLQTGGHPPKVDASVVEQIQQLQGDLHFETYISLTCQNCPEVVQSLNLMAALNPRVQSVVIDGALFQKEVGQRQIMAVPTIFLNGELFDQGRLSIEEILAKLDTGLEKRTAEQLNARAPYDLLVVGGGPAGAAAAIYSARKGIRTGVVAERFGGQVLDTMSIENFISVTGTEGPKFAAALEQHVKTYDVDIINLQRAEKLIPATQENPLVGIQLASGASLKAKTIVMATGARWREINVPGERKYRNRGVAYCPHCDGPLFKGKHVAVIGGGNSGVEAAIDLAGIVNHVTLLEFDKELRADAILQRKLKSLGNVTIHTNAQTTEIKGDESKVTELNFTDRATGEQQQIKLEGVFVQIGLVPNTEWLKGSLELSRHGEIVVDARGQTSVPGVFAAGDVTTVPYKQIVIAVGEGAKAALSAFDYLIRSDLPA